MTQDGEIIGRHKGIIHYTVGQRRGLGIAAPSPYYVKEIRPESNEVVLCSNEELFRHTLFAEDVNWVSIPEPAGRIRVEAKIRYRHKPAAAVAEMTENGRLKVTFDEPQRAVTKGQSVVLYDGDLVGAAERSAPRNDRKRIFGISFHESCSFSRSASVICSK